MYANCPNCNALFDLSYNRAGDIVLCFCGIDLIVVYSDGIYYLVIYEE